MLIVRIIITIFWIWILHKAFDSDDISFCYSVYGTMEITYLLGAIAIISAYDNYAIKSFLISEFINIGIVILIPIIYNKFGHNFFKNYRNFQNKGQFSIKFEQFKNLYAVAPNKWLCYEEMLRYRTSSYNYNYFKFKNIFEYFKYIIFIHNEAKNLEKENMDAQLAEVTQMWIADIEKYKKENGVKF